VITLKTIDAHVAGQPLRLIVDGFPSVRGKTMLDKRDWAERHADHLRRILMLEPRGHQDMCGALLTEPVSPASHAGLLFLQNDGFATMSLHGVIAATAIALDRQLLMPGGNGGTVVYDTPSGTVRTRARQVAAKGWAVSVLNVPSFVLSGGLPVALASAGGRQIRADVAFGGAFYAIVDSEAAGLAIDAAHLSELRRVGSHLARTVDEAHRVAHPLESRLCGIAGTIFTGPPADDRSDLRSVTVFAHASVDRSPCGTGMGAVMAVLSAMGLLSDGQPFVTESLIGAQMSGRVVGRTTVGEFEAITPEITGAAWITGEHTFFVEDDDPLSDGFYLG
jgi:proline racemase